MSHGGDDGRFLRVALLAVLCQGLMGSAFSVADEPADCEEAMTALRGPSIKETEGFLTRCPEADSTSYDGYIALARIHLSRRQFSRAEELLRTAMRQQPERIEAIFEYSKLLDGRGDKAGAHEQLKRVVGTAPQTPAAWKGIGYLTMEPANLLDLEESAGAFTRAFELNSEDLESLFNLGKVHMRRGKWEEAMHAFDQILHHEPESFPASYQLGMTEYLLGDYEKAVAKLARTLELAPESLVTRWSYQLACARLDECAYSEPAIGPVTGEGEQHQVRVPHLTDVAGDVGVARFDAGRGSAWADYDGDGYVDLFTMGHFAGTLGATSLFRNDAGMFEDVTQFAGVEVEAGMASAFADYDNDGDPDLYITRDGWYGGKSNSLLRNDGGTRFTDQTQTAGVESPGSSFGVSWGDLDGDGLLDLFVANGVSGDGSPNHLYLNLGSGEFKDAAQTAGIEPGRSIGCTLGDYDNDGDLDLYVVNFQQLNSFYRNDGSDPGESVRFSDVTKETGTQLPVGSYFAFFLDFDDDGLLDLFCTQMSAFKTVLQSWERGGTLHNTDRPALYHNQGNGHFADQTYQAGLGHSYGTTGVGLGDANSDGRQDIYLANGGASITRLEPDALLLNLGNGKFADRASAAGIEQLGKGQGVTFADYDGDGDQDIYVPIGGVFPGDRWRNRLYRNDGEGVNWLTVKLVGTRSNRDAIGARVRVRASGVDRHETVSSGGGFGVTNSLALDVGLGDAEKVTELEVRWPSGHVDVLTDLAPNDVVELVEGSTR